MSHNSLRLDEGANLQRKHEASTNMIDGIYALLAVRGATPRCHFGIISTFNEPIKHFSMCFGDFVTGPDGTNEVVPD